MEGQFDIMSARPVTRRTEINFSLANRLFCSLLMLPFFC